MTRLPSICCASLITTVGLVLASTAWSQETQRAAAEKSLKQTPSSAVESDGSPNSADSLSEEQPDRVYKSDEEWRRILTYNQYVVTRLKGTEPAFSGRYAHGRFKGTFLCVCCGAKLFDARHKFESGTGWPSFWRPVEVKALTESLDRSEAELRVEVTCTRCGAHLGHVFSDGPAPTGLRYCINSLALKLDSERERSAPQPRRSTPRRRTQTTRETKPTTPVPSTDSTTSDSSEPTSPERF